MPRPALDSVIRHVRQIAACDAAAEQSDAALVSRYSAGGDDAAFTALWQRHAAMVWRVCRGALRHDQDAEDAFQATFAVLARKAASIRKGASVASWLHGVAYRVATRARRDGALRRAREQAGARVRREAAPCEVALREALALVDEEVSRLPERYRAAFVLCCLEGRSVPEAARALGTREGTVAATLCRARAQLRRRLARRGVTLTAALAAADLARPPAAALPPLRFRPVPHGPAITLPPDVTALAAGTVKIMSLSKSRLVLFLLLAAGISGGGTVLLARQSYSATVSQGALAGEVAVGVPPQVPEPARPAAAERPAVSDAVQRELRELRGTWATTTTEHRAVNGIPQPPREKQVTFVIADDKLTILGDDGHIDQQMTFTLDPSRQPKAIDLTSLQLGTFLGIYRLDGDTLRFHWDGRPGKRPPAFLEDHALVWGVLRRKSRTPAETLARYPSAPGCYWLVEPSSCPGTLATLGTVLMFEKDAGGAAYVTLASAFSDDQTLQYRPVLVDAEKNRYLPGASGAGTSGRRAGAGVTLSRWRMDPKVLPADKVAGVGIEVVTPESHKIDSAAALDRARKEGVEVLPYPANGKPFEFSLTTTDGKVIRSTDFRGKVILVDCWATWCSPCMSLQPELKKLYERSHKDGLEIVGVSYDRNLAAMRKACDALALPWAQVLVPAGGAKRQLWDTASAITSLPRYFLIDRQGLLRADTPACLNEEVAVLLRETPGRRK